MSQLCGSGLDDRHRSTLSASPQCNTYTYPDYCYTRAGCGIVFTGITVSLGTITPGVISLPVLVITSYPRVSFLTLAPGPVTMTQQSSPISTTSAGPQSHAGEITAIVVGGVFRGHIAVRDGIVLMPSEKSWRKRSNIRSSYGKGVWTAFNRI
jgi:hypothetical protein